MNELLYTAHEYDDPIDLASPAALDDPMTARLLLIELQRNERKAAHLRATMAAIQGTYQARLDELAARERSVRESLAIYVERNGTASFPDVGSVSARQKGPDVKIQTDEAFAAWLIATGNESQMTVDQTYRFKPGAKKLAREWMKEHGGELPRGCDLVPESVGIVIRKAE